MDVEAGLSVPVPRRGPQISKENRPSKGFWKLYARQVDKEERELMEEWIKTADSILIFSSLFSAVITSFIIEGYKDLQPNPDQRLSDIMTTISAQLLAMHNNSDIVPAYTPPAPDKFRPESITVWMNGMWFASLAFSLVTALFGALLHESVRSYKRSISRFRAPDKRVQVRAYLFSGILEWSMPDIVNAIPTLIEITLILFLGGLTLFAWKLYQPIAIVLSSILGALSLAYMLVSIAPLFFHNFPCRAPLSQWLFRTVSYAISLLSRYWYIHLSFDSLLSSSALRNAENLSKAFHFVTSAVDEDEEVQKFAECFPGLLNENDRFITAETKSALCHAFLSSYNASLGRMVDELLENVGNQPDKKLAELLRAISSAVTYGKPNRIFGLESLNESWFLRCLTLFSHPSLKVMQGAMTIYAQLATAEEIPRPSSMLAPHELPTVEDLERARSLSLPERPIWLPDDVLNISWDMIIKCFDRVDMDEAGFIRKAWPDVYKAFAFQSNIARRHDQPSPEEISSWPLAMHSRFLETLRTLQESHTLIAFVNSAEILLQRVYEFYEFEHYYPNLVKDVHALVRACFAFADIPEAQTTLNQALTWCREQPGLPGKVLYNEFRKITKKL